MKVHYFLNIPPRQTYNLHVEYENLAWRSVSVIFHFCFLTEKFAYDKIQISKVTNLDCKYLLSRDG